MKRQRPSQGRRRKAFVAKPYQRFYGRTQQLNVEMKFHDVDLDDAIIAQGANVQLALLTIPEGNGEEQRIGRSITIKKISWRYEVVIPATAIAVNTSDSVRILLIHDKQCNGALPTDALPVLETSDYQSMNNLSNNKRFRILMDKTVDMACPSGSGRGSTDTLQFGEQRKNFTFFKDCNIPVEYDNSETDGTITTIRSSNILCILATASGVAGFASKIRFRYTDR